MTRPVFFRRAAPILVILLMAQTVRAQQEPPLPVTAPTGEGITLNLPDASVSDVLDRLSQAAGLTVVSDTVIPGRFSVISHRPLSLAEAINLLNTFLEGNGYTAVLQGRILRIVPLAAPQTASSPVRPGDSPASVPSPRTGAAPGTAALSPAAAQAASTIYGQVSAVPDADTNSLMIMTSTKNFERVLQILEELDRAVPQVLIKVLLAEVTLTNNTDVGMEFSVLNLRPSGLGQQLSTNFRLSGVTEGLVARVVESDVTATIAALERIGRVNVLSRPYILTSDNQAASITVGQRVPIVTDTRITDTGQTISSYRYEDVGIILNVTPHINPDGLVTLDVAPEISSLTPDFISVSDTVNIPIIARRAAQSRVAILDGQTIVIGGMMQNQKNTSVRRIPILGSIPLLGALFRRTVTDVSKTELLIFLTPCVSRLPEELEKVSAAERNASQHAMGEKDAAALQEFLDRMAAASKD